MLALLLAAGLGVSHFTATGPKACQARVLEGVLSLHSFMYAEARKAFVAAEAEKPCPIAFWGEAMTYDHPLWDEHDGASGKAALAKIPPDARVSPLERGLIEAARALFESGRGAWMERLAKLHADLPADDEATLFYALSLYANSDGGVNVKRAMQAAALAMDVFERNPNHPGAAHYLIHACDSPDHAILALKAARKYAQIAPAASHALHMPSHIFFQLGMWEDAEKSNDAAVAASRASHNPETHSFIWLAGARLELRKPDQVLKMIEEQKDRRAGNVVKGMWIESTRSWSKIDQLFGPPLEHPNFADPGDAVAIRTRLDAAALAGDEAEADKWAKQLVAFDIPRDPKFRDYAKKVARARLAQAHSYKDTGTIGDAIDAMRALADDEDRDPQGPCLHNPAREVLGDLLMRSRRFQEAEVEFRTALDKRPNRWHALEGLLESAEAAGDAKAAKEAQAALGK
jgi:tetratricopeptide (TPR) repeat protein